MRTFIALTVLALAAVAGADVVRPAPNFLIETGGREKNLRGFRGQPVVLLVAKSSKVGAFRKQVRVLEEIYEQFASRQVVFVAAIEEGEADVRTNIPFAVAADGAKVAADFGVKDSFN